MQEINLLKAQKIIVDSLEASDIEQIDRTELIMNLYHFLYTKDYSRNIRTLLLFEQRRKWSELSGSTNTKTK